MTKYGNNYKYIDLQKKVSESKSGVLKKLPDSVVRLLVKIIRQNDLNDILNKNSENYGVDFLANVLDGLNITVDIEGEENLPDNGKCFFIANHPFGVVDGLVLTHTVGKKYGSLKAIANEVFMLMPQMHPIIAAVNVFGRSSKEYLNALNQVYNSDVPITHFPAGLLSRIYNWKIQDPPWQKSFVSKAITCERDIVPFYFYGRNSRLFYAIYLFRKLLGIKVAVELMLLSREMFRKKIKRLK